MTSQRQKDNVAEADRLRGRGRQMTWQRQTDAVVQRQIDDVAEADR